MLTLGAGYGLRRSEIAAVRGDHVEDALGGPVLLYRWAVAAGRTDVPRSALRDTVRAVSA